MNVKLISLTDQSVVESAVSKPYGTKPSLDVAKKVICVKKHLSCAEHIVMSFDVDGVSRALLQEHARHRIASLTVKSTRFQLHKIKEFSTDDIFIKPKNKYIRLLSRVVYNVSKLAIRIGLYLADGEDKEQVKYLLPEGMLTSFVWTINLRALMNYFDLRDPESGSVFPEIRELARNIKNSLKGTYVESFIEGINHENN